MKSVDLRKMDVEALEKEVALRKKELFDLRLGTAGAHVKDNSQYKKLRVHIARALTYIKQKHNK